MPVGFSNVRLSAAMLTLLLCAPRAGAQIAATSPFLPAPAAGGAGAPTANAPLEFRGIMETSEGKLYRIVDPARKTGAWVKLNEREPNLDFTIKRHDAGGNHDVVVAEQQGRTFTLALRDPKVNSMGPGSQQLVPPPPSPAPNMPPSITNTVVVNPTPADEQRRLEAVAAEVARRRALREQAQQQVNQGLPGAPQVVPPPPIVQPSVTTPGLPRAAGPNQQPGARAGTARQRQ